METETLKLVFQAIQTLAVIVGLTFAVRQLDLLRKSYIDLHEWNRRKAAYDAVNEFKSLTEDVKLLNRAFNFVEQSDPISMERIHSAIQNDDAVRIAINKYPKLL